MGTEQEVINYRDRITADPRVMVGKPVIRGTRIPVETVLEELAHNPNINELLAAHPALTLEDVQACLAYAQAMVRGEEVIRPSWRGAHRAAPSA